MNEETVRSEIDLSSLFRILVRKWYVIVASIFVLFIIAFIYAFLMLDNVYEANASIIVLVSNKNQSDDQNYTLSYKLTKTYTELAMSSLVVSRVIEESDIDITDTQFRNSLTVTPTPTK